MNRGQGSGGRDQGSGGGGGAFAEAVGAVAAAGLAAVASAEVVGLSEDHEAVFKVDFVVVGEEVEGVGRVVGLGHGLIVGRDGRFFELSQLESSAEDTAQMAIDGADGCADRVFRVA